MRSKMVSKRSISAVDRRLKVIEEGSYNFIKPEAFCHNLDC
jgi:hypothetical protein